MVTYLLHNLVCLPNLLSNNFNAKNNHSNTIILPILVGISTNDGLLCVLAEYRRAPPLSLDFKGRSSSDYESIPSFGASAKDTTIMPSLKQLKESVSTNANSDYESIDLETGDKLDERDPKKSGLSLAQLKQNTASNNSSHDYESIDFTHISGIIESIDTESPVSSPYIPDGATRNKFLKIDSEGYASVLYPDEVDDSWEFDCLNQDKYHENSANNSSSITVENVEEAWKHQCEKGYAPLTLQREPPPLFSRTKSAPNSAPLPPKPEPQDYEVPFYLLPLPPPPPVAQRRSSLVKQLAICSDLDSPGKGRSGVEVPEKEGSRDSKVENKQNGSDKAVLSKAESLEVCDLRSDRPTMRSRVMTAPVITVSNLAIANQQ